MAERQSARMSEIKNGRSSLYGAKHSKCNHVMTLGFNGLNSVIPMHFSQALDRSQVAVNDSYSGAPLHIPTLIAAGTNVR